MPPSGYPNAGVRRGPLTDASSKANSLANPPPSKPAPAPPVSAENYQSYGRSSGQPAGRNKNSMPGGSTLEPPAQTQRNFAASHSSRNGTSFRLSSTGVKKLIGPWELGQTVGTGGTCSVRMVRHARTGGIAVAKIISKVTAEKVRARSLANLSQRIQIDHHQFTAPLGLPIGLEREIVIMRLLHHPNIVQLYDVWENRDQM
jgi:serine/threonine-protein kinase HSL1 (negative regulator of Swe1 kinase)